MRHMNFNLGLVVTVAAALVCTTSTFAEEKPGDEGFVSIFDGKTLDGWHVSSKTGHGTGGRWVVEEGAIVGSRDRPRNGAIRTRAESPCKFTAAATTPSSSSAIARFA